MFQEENLRFRRFHFHEKQKVCCRCWRKENLERTRLVEKASSCRTSSWCWRARGRRRGSASAKTSTSSTTTTTSSRTWSSKWRWRQRYVSPFRFRRLLASPSVLSYGIGPSGGSRIEQDAQTGHQEDLDAAHCHHSVAQARPADRLHRAQHPQRADRLAGAHARPKSARPQDSRTDSRHALRGEVYSLLSVPEYPV